MNFFARGALCASVVAVLLTVLPAAASADPTLTTLVTFNGANGEFPEAGLIADAAGNLYGTTSGSPFGSSSLGTVFMLTASSNYSLTTLVTFNGTNGSLPVAGLIADAAGNLYGTTLVGVNGRGTVFQLAAANNYALTTLTTFNGTNDGDPHATLIADTNGNLYGTTEGGRGGIAATVFKLTAANNYAITTLVTFNGTNGGGPGAGLIADSAGNLYGTTSNSGPGGWGTVFTLNAANNYALTTLASFNGSNGANPVATLIADAAGNLYGTTGAGGFNSDGTVFKLDASNNYALTTLTTFNGANGKTPAASLIADAAGNLYGTTQLGGTNNQGTVFKLDASNNYALTTLYSFSGGNDQGQPLSNLIADASGNLYGTTSEGEDGSQNSALGDGTVFELSGTGFVVVPEPASAVLLALGGFAAGWLAVRRRS